MTTNLSTSFVVKLVAKAAMAEELAQFLAGALEMANDEEGTIVWFALRSDAITFWIVDAFANEGDRQTHITGPIAQALISNADRLLDLPPEILPAEVLASKVP